MDNPTGEARLVKMNHVLLAAILFIAGLAVKLLSEYQVGTLWEIAGELGTFLAAVTSVHLLHEFFTRDHEQRLFDTALHSGLKEELGIFKDSALTEVVAPLQKAVENLSLNVDYMKIGENYHGTIVTEELLYSRAIKEIRNARIGVDIFTSYLLEIDSEIPAVIEERKKYFQLLLSLPEMEPAVSYRRLIQVDEKKELEEFYKKATIYQNHIKEMAEKEEEGKTPTYIRHINRRRPTTYAIIDRKVLLWQINQVGENDDMKIYGMYIIKDPGAIFIEHFSKEFNDYWNHRGTKPLKVRVSIT